MGLTGILRGLTVIVAVIAGFVTGEPAAFLVVLAVPYVITETPKIA